MMYILMSGKIYYDQVSFYFVSLSCLSASKMSLPKKNILANFAGSIWTALISIVFIPIYIKYMGVEAYGLIGFFTTIQSFFVIIDMGLSTTMSREMARLSSLTNKEDEIYSTSKTLELTYWMAAIGFGLVVVVAAPLITSRWLNAEQLSLSDIKSAIVLMGVSLTFQLPSSVYSGGLAGFQKQILLNKINITVATIRAFGALIALILFSDKIKAFFGWQIIISVIQTLLMAYYFNRLLPEPISRSLKYKETIKKIWRFSAGVTITTFMAIIFMQIDKIVLSKMLSLKTFGYYMIASSLSAAVYRVVTPVSSVTMPRFTELITMKNYEALTTTYHNACKLVSILIMPAISVGILFSREILLLWTKDVSIAENSHMVLSLLLFGTMFNALYHIPYSLQLASGWNRLGLYSTTISALFVVPMTILAVRKFGADGAASVWVILNLFYVFLVVQIMHMKLLKAEKLNWYLYDVLIPMITAFSAAIIGRLISHSSIFQHRSLLVIIMSLVFGYLLVAGLSIDIKKYQGRKRL